jgi:RNA polymerase sigma factor (sigma-70 family)
MSASDPNPRIDAISTRWSLMGLAGGGSPETAAEARRQLVLRYSPAIRGYVRAIVFEADDAEELAQDVIVRMLKGDFDGADPSRGRFRDLLKTAIRNMIRNHWARQKRRRGASLAGDVSEPDLLAECADPTAHDPWLDAWRKSVLDLAWSALAEHEREHPASVAHTVLRLRTEFPDDTSDQLAARLAKKLGKSVRADSIRQQLRRARTRFAELVVEEVASSVDAPSGDRVEEELIALGLWESIRDLLPADWKTASRSPGV